LEDAFEEGAVTVAATSSHFVDAPGGPSVNGGIDVMEGEFIGRDLAIGVHVPFAKEEFELAFGKVGVELGHGDHVEGEVPGG
jgi:hypothetical protein